VCYYSVIFGILRVDAAFVSFPVSEGIKGKVVRHEDVRGSGCIDPRFLDLGTSWR
jgi:hypothetical protein